MKHASARPELEAHARIDELAPGGDGVAIVTLNGERRAVFVRGAAMGDEVSLAIDASQRPARGRVLALLKPGPQRVEPACPYVDRCGGCDWMHLSLAGQTEAHLAQLSRALPDAWRAHPIAVHDAEESLGYRTRARLHIRASGGRAVVGMHEAKTHDPLPVSSCKALDPRLDRARESLGPLLEGVHGTGEAQLALGPIEAGDSARRPVLELHWSGPLAPRCFARFEHAVTAAEFSGVRVFSGDVKRPATIGDPTPWMMGADDKPLRLAPGRFAQASERANRALGRRVLSLAREVAGDAARIVELFAGAGNFTVLFASLGAKVTAVEVDRALCEAARANLASRGLAAKVVEADAATYEPRPETTLLVLDPPRSGARATAERLARSPIRRVLYISCDAQTLARDLGTLEARYVPLAIETFAMFPQTSHFETVILLGRRPFKAAPKASVS